MLSSRLGVLGRLVANNVEEAKEAGAESVHPQMKSHVLTIPKRKKTVTLSLVHRTVCRVKPNLKYEELLTITIQRVFMEMNVFIRSDAMLYL